MGIFIGVLLALAVVGIVYFAWFGIPEGWEGE